MNLLKMKQKAIKSLYLLGFLLVHGNISPFKFILINDNQLFSPLSLLKVFGFDILQFYQDMVCISNLQYDYFKYFFQILFSSFSSDSNLSQVFSAYFSYPVFFRCLSLHFAVKLITHVAFHHPTLDHL